jgi:hypothetical protein
MQTIRRFLADETAATAIENGLIAAGIAARDHRRGRQSRLVVEVEVRLDQHLAEVARIQPAR